MATTYAKQKLKIFPGRGLSGKDIKNRLRNRTLQAQTFGEESYMVDENMAKFTKMSKVEQIQAARENNSAMREAQRKLEQYGIKRMKCFQPLNQKLKKPIWSKYDNKFVEHVILPCGKCAACINRKIMEWTFRLDNERINSACTYFVTLTYNNYHVPINKYGKLTLDKTHVQLFLKKLRYDHDNDPEYGIYEDHYFKTNLRNEKIKYYAAGEYGTLRQR